MGGNCRLPGVVHRRLRGVEKAASAVTSDIERSLDLNAILNLLEHPVLVIGLDYRVLYANAASRDRYGVADAAELLGVHCYELGNDTGCACRREGADCAVRTSIASRQRSQAKHYLWHPARGGYWEDVVATPLLDAAGEVQCVILEPTDCTELHRARQAAEAIDNELGSLRTLLPICSACKQVRTANDTWESIESHLRRHANVTISHGLCPHCLNQLYPEADGGMI